METQLSAAVRSHLACPVCHSRLELGDEATCTDCQRTFGRIDSGQMTSESMTQ